MLVRLQKFLAEAGLASRRESEQIILSGRVAVNGRPVRVLGSKVDPLHDRVTLDGSPVRAQRKLYVAVNKPAGWICTRRDPEGRRCVGDLLPAEWKSLYTVGRLDFDSEGLIFLTNDGEFALRITHPRYGITKKYWVVVEGSIANDVIPRLLKGTFHEGERLCAKRARILDSAPTHSIFEVELGEGKNREVRRLFEAQGLSVARLKRTQIGHIKLGELPGGKWRVLSPTEVKPFLSRDESTPRESKRRSDTS